MGLDFHHTCPDIDSNIGGFKEGLIEEIKDIIEDSRLHTEEELKHEYLSVYSEQIYSQLEHYFEGVRKTNEDMRSEADAQIKRLQNELSDKEYEIEELNESISKLEAEMSY